ncbi:hypothetical protein NE237_004721 [Protea cynaroides]|uniref:DNA polymerase alpha catalytic subunit N-terminal domain-containing protein n=1 Tax=Protea cynaroides TaxID=273540 RepID=A0A9Q0QTV8_9MAGN|nr:hypothetical protein NE237_004721 [Protea cynaroides]
MTVLQALFSGRVSISPPIKLSRIRISLSICLCQLHQGQIQQSHCQRCCQMNRERKRDGGGVSGGADAAARAEALERLKVLCRGTRRSETGFQIKMEDPIYDTVAEEDYTALVAKRREEVRGFIVDDDGLGYGDDGQEEDWSQAGLPPSSDESEVCISVS